MSVDHLRVVTMTDGLTYESDEEPVTAAAGDVGIVMRDVRVCVEGHVTDTVELVLVPWRQVVRVEYAMTEDDDG